MKALTLGEILAVEDLPITQVEVKQWGGTVGVRTLRADQRAELERQFSKRKPSEDPAGFRKAVLQAALAAPDGSPLLADTEAAGQLMAKNAEAVETVLEVALEVNGFRKKDVEELEKN